MKFFSFLPLILKTKNDLLQNYTKEITNRNDKKNYEKRKIVRMLKTTVINEKQMLLQRWISLNK